MSVNSPSKINQNGLVFYIDTPNPKSYVGKPTTNLLTNPTPTYELNGGEFSQYADLAPIFNTNGLVPYSLSLDMKVNKNGSVYVYMQNGSWTKYSFVGQSVNATTDYQRFKFENLTPAISTPSETQAILAFYTGYGSGVNPSVKNVQVELGSVATPFVVGSRSNTQGLLDLTRNASVDLTNAVYDSNSLLYFDGNGFCTTSAAVLPASNSSPMTLVAWCKPTNLTSWQTVLGTHGSFRQIGFNGSNFYFGGNGGGGNNFVSGGSVSNNNWYMLAMAYDGGTTGYGYLNGTLASSGNIGSNGGSNGVQCIGSYHSGGYEKFRGYISISAVYNRTLSADEVLKIYYRSKSRYGL